jgi:hypothetical protein
LTMKDLKNKNTNRIVCILKVFYFEFTKEMEHLRAIDLS